MSFSHLTPAKILYTTHDPLYAEERRFWQGCPSVLCSPGGTLFMGWYSGGTKEPSQFNYNVLYRCDIDGRPDGAPLLVTESVPEADIRAIDIQLWLDPAGRSWVFWVQRCDRYPHADPRHLSVWAVTTDDIDAAVIRWSEPRRVSEGFIRTQPTVLTDGRWLLWAYDWTNDRYMYSESSDQGGTWGRRTGGRKLETPFDEGMAVELRDGTIRMLARSAAGVLAQSESTDGGKSWTDGCRSSFRAPSSRLFFQRLRSGNLLLVRNDAESWRQSMTASLSCDDGRSFPYSLMLDAREPVSYPDAVEDRTGKIHLVYDRGRTTDKEILYSCFTEADVKAGRLAEPGSFLARVVSKAPVEPYDHELYRSRQLAEQLKFAQQG